MENIQKLLVVVTILVLGIHGFSCFGCHKDEREALLQLKSAINYPNGSALDDWTGGPSDDCCDWDEVSCGKSTGRVVTLYLDGVRQADWYLNASLFLPFPHLQKLYLDNNSITGWTHHLRQLSSLEELTLEDNKLKGIIDLYDVEALQNLKVLDLSGNNVDGFKRIHGSTCNTSKLEILALYEITFQDAKTLLDSLLSFPSLKVLHLMGNDFKGIVETTGWLCKLKKIQALDIAYNNLHGQIPLCLGNLTSLQHLDLGLNSLHGKLPSFLANLTSLKFLDLSSNQFVGNVADSPLMKLTSLRLLSLSNNNFQIPQTLISFSNHSSLKFLLLQSNDLIPDNTTHQPFIPKFQLSFLSLSNCKIRAPLPGFILHQHNLTYLDLSHNYIEGSFPAWILENNTFLVTLTLANNFLIGSTHLSRYPHSHIKLLDVSHNVINNLKGNLGQSLPNILFLNLSKNSIKEITPLTFRDMKNEGAGRTTLFISAHYK